MRLDRVRRNVGPVHLDLVEAYAQGRVNRRDFLRRGAVIGLSVPMMAAVISACGDDSDSGGSSGTDASAAPGTDGGSSGGAKGGVIKIATQTPAATLDPVAMQDLGAYGLIAQSFEFLAALSDDGNITQGLATKWEPNEDGSVWTFTLRSGVKWQKGGDFTSADVAATMDRLVEGGNAGLDGVIAVGSVDATDPGVAVFTLESPNGNFPYLVSVFNAQAVITPKGYTLGTTLDANPDGTGPWILESYDATTGARFVRNDAYWGGAPALDAIEYQFFDDIGTMVTAMQGKSVDALQQFSVIGGDALLADPDFNTIGVRAATHRQIWMRCDTGTFADKRVRQALAYTFDRARMVETLFKGKADIGNDHVIAPFLPFFDPSLPQREKDIEKAKALLAEAGAEGLTADLHFGELQEIPDLAALIQAGAKEAGMTINLAGQNNGDFYGAAWCPGEPAEPPCSGATELGIVDYGHRPTPDVYLNAALSTNGIWNSSQYGNADFDAAFKEYQAAVTADGQKAAVAKIQANLNDEVPVGVPYFYNYLSGHSKKFTGVRVSALGQMYFDKASQA